MLLLIICQQIYNLVNHSCLKSSWKIICWWFVGTFYVCVPLAKTLLAPSVIVASAYAIDCTIQRKLSWKGVLLQKKESI